MTKNVDRAYAKWIRALKTHGCQNFMRTKPVGAYSLSPYRGLGFDLPNGQPGHATVVNGFGEVLSPDMAELTAKIKSLEPEIVV